MTDPLIYTLEVRPWYGRGLMWTLEAPDGRPVGAWRTNLSNRGLWLAGQDGEYHQTRGIDAFEGTQNRLSHHARSQATIDARYLLAGRGEPVPDDVAYGPVNVSITVRMEPRT